jgi:hypothetical protein
MSHRHARAHAALFTVNFIYGINYVVAKGLMPAIIGPSGFIANNGATMVVQTLVDGAMLGKSRFWLGFRHGVLGSTKTTAFLLTDKFCLFSQRNSFDE